jgi:glutaredoxin-dependent peroxiredoxin
MSQFRDAYDEFRRINVQVATVSVDSPYSHLAWARQIAIPFPMISDFNRDLLRAYDALAPASLYLRDTAKRTVFLIDPAGVIRYAWYPPPEGGLPPVGAALAEAQRLALAA